MAPNITDQIRLIGHENTKRQIDIAANSAKARNVAMPHMLFSGAPGCGKTSLAKEMARILKCDFISVIPETMKDINSIKKILTSLNHDGYDERGNRIGKINPSIIFMDEIHRLPMYGQEKLGIVMENLLLETGRPNKYFWIPHFTLIGATTLAGELSKPFLNRFKLNFHFQAYSMEDSLDIINLHAARIKIGITRKAARDIAKRGRGVPRIMIGYLERCRDVALANRSYIITSYITTATFSDLGIDEFGLTKVELKILKVLYESDKPIGLETLAVITNESAKTIKNELEPYLMQQGYMVRSGSGRIITPDGREYLEKQGLDFKKVEISADYERT